MVNRKYNFNPVSDIMRYFDPVWRLNLIEINLKKYTETNWFGFFTESRLHESFLLIIQMFPDTKFPQTFPDSKFPDTARNREDLLAACRQHESGT